MWFGTQNGLVRFDGFEFKNIPTAGLQTGGQEIKSLAASKKDGLWMAINGGGFKNYDRQKFQATGEDPAASLSANVVLESWSGVLWGGTDTGLSCWETNHFNDSLVEGSNVLVISLAEDVAGRIWMGTAEHGLWNWKNGRLRRGRRRSASIDIEICMRWQRHREGELWVGTGQGLFCYSRAGLLTNVVEVGSEVRALLVDRRTECCGSEPRGKVWCVFKTVFSRT